MYEILTVDGAEVFLRQSLQHVQIGRRVLRCLNGCELAHTGDLKRKQNYIAVQIVEIHNGRWEALKVYIILIKALTVVGPEVRRRPVEFLQRQETRLEV